MKDMKLYCNLGAASMEFFNTEDTESTEFGDNFAGRKSILPVLDQRLAGTVSPDVLEYN